MDSKSETWMPWERELRAQVEKGRTVVASVTGDRKKRRYLNLLEWADMRGIYVYVGRQVRWAGENPYVRGPYDWSNPYKLGRGTDRATIIGRYETEHLAKRSDLLERIPELRGKVLGCWCAPEACHGDVLARLAMAGNVS
jgi:hypothetical protein